MSPPLGMLNEPCVSSSSVSRTWWTVFPVCVLLVMTTMFIHWLPLSYEKRQVRYILDTENYNRSLLEEDYRKISTRWSRKGDQDCLNRSVALGIALAFRGVAKLQAAEIPLKYSPFFLDLFPTFCQTANQAGYCYTFYIAHDFNDPVLSLPEGQFTFLQVFKETASKNERCLDRININLKFVSCNYSGRPAWAQNEAMMAAYRDNMDYYFMANDDTLFTSSNWTFYLTESLQNMIPPNVGTVGPTHHGGNEAIMTYNFAHRTHIDIFGYFYPPVFSNWSADEWMTRVYEPHNSYKHPLVEVFHIREMGQRYRSTPFPPNIFEQVINKTKLVLNSYLGNRRDEIKLARIRKQSDYFLQIVVKELLAKSSPRQPK